MTQDQRMSLKEYYHLLQAHDWFYQYSDAYNVFKEGEAERRYILNIANRYPPAYRELYQAYRKAVFSGKSFGTEKQPLPEEPQHDAA